MFATHTFLARARHLQSFGVSNYLADAVPLRGERQNVWSSQNTYYLLHPFPILWRNCNG
ncbi:MAG: hypothetical protein QNJ63_16730 [Calothrix sp. MO_192.B10]|nr:hypothetical protein [Calothrix sp. MO_192.B10]